MVTPPDRRSRDRIVVADTLAGMAKPRTPSRDWTIEELEKDGMAFAVLVDGELVTRFEERSSAAAYVKEQTGGSSSSSSTTRPSASSDDTPPASS